MQELVVCSTLNEQLILKEFIHKMFVFGLLKLVKC